MLNSILSTIMGFIETILTVLVMCALIVWCLAVNVQAVAALRKDIKEK